MTIGDRIPVTRRHPVDDTTNDTTTSGNGQAAADPTGTPGETITPRSEHPSAPGRHA